MKIGQRCTEPETRAKGRVVNIIGKQAVCLTDDKARFFRLPLDRKKRKAVQRRKRFVSKPCKIRIRGLEGVLRGKTVRSAGGRLAAVVTDGNLIWHGQEVGLGDAEIVLLGRGRPTKGQQDEVLAVGARRK